MTVFGLRFFGAQGSYSTIHHPLYTEQPLFVIDGGDSTSGPDQSWAAFSAAMSITPPSGFHNTSVLGIHLRLSRDGHWVLYRPKELAELTNGSGFVSQLDKSELEKLRFKADQSPLIFFDEFLGKYNDSLLFINVIQPAHRDLSSIFKSLETLNMAEKIVLQSEFTDTTRELRKKNVRWLTGSTVAEIAKSFFMNSIFLETTMQLDSDVVVTSKLNTRLFEELFRRQKLIWFVTDDPTYFWDLRMKFPKLGLVTTRPGLFLQTVAPSPKNN